MSSHELRAPAPGFMTCFEDQLGNLTAALRTEAPVVVSRTEARKTVAFIEHCYGIRQPLAMPWLESGEQRRAQELANV